MSGTHVWRIDRPRGITPTSSNLSDLKDAELAAKRTSLAADLAMIDRQLAQMGPLRSRREDIAFRLRKVESHISLRKAERRSNRCGGASRRRKGTA